MNDLCEPSSNDRSAFVDFIPFLTVATAVLRRHTVFCGVGTVTDREEVSVEVELVGTVA